jgi:hypothetical protein
MAAASWEHRKMLSDGFCGRVAFDALGPLVPRRDVSAGSQHEDRIVMDAVDQATKNSVAARFLQSLTRCIHLDDRFLLASMSDFQRRPTPDRLGPCPAQGLRRNVAPDIQRDAREAFTDCGNFCNPVNT